MDAGRGIIAIMGSGETTDSMVRVHRYLMDQLEPPVRAAFIDTPAGFQMNVADLYEKAKEYFAKRFSQPLALVSFKSLKTISPLEAEKAFQLLRQANYIFVGPGSPTYALKNWAGTPIPGIIGETVETGRCFVAASAAALTLGRFTLPVYEIYKVGEEVHWVEGLNLLGRFGLPLVVIPHWNNAEGGSHDTRFCYMGETRLKQLETLLPEEIPILGIDEHTSCILDFRSGQMLIRGIGGVTRRFRGEEKVFRDGQIFPLEELARLPFPAGGRKEIRPVTVPVPPPEPFLDQVRSLKEQFEKHLRNREGAALIDALIGLDKMIWKSCRDFEDEEKVSRAREAFRSMVVQLGLHLDEAPKGGGAIGSPFIDLLLKVREKLRLAKQWTLADEIRKGLQENGVIVEDIPEGSRWHFKNSDG